MTRRDWGGPAGPAIGVYLLVRAWQLVMLGAPIVTPDTPMYRFEGQRWLDFRLVSFTGHELRPWPMSGLYALLPNDRARMLAQFVIATGCWVYCIHQFGRLSSNRVAGALASFAVAVLALTLGVSGFDAVLLAESVTISIAALYVGTLLSLARGRGRLPTLAVAFLAALLLALLRPVLVLLLPGVAVAGYVNTVRSEPERRGRGRVVVGAVAALTLVAMAYSWTYNVQIDRTWGTWVGSPGLNGRTLHQYYVAGYETRLGPEIVEAMVEAGGPSCLRVELAASGPDPMRDHLAEERKTCPEGQRWLSDHFLPALATQFVTDPSLARSYFRDVLGDQSVLRTDGRDSLPSLVPSVLSAVFFSEERGLGDPLVLWSVAAVVLVVLQRRRGAGGSLAAGAGEPWPRRIARRRGLELCLGYTALAGYAGLAGTAMLSALDASRVALPVTVLLRLVLVAVVVPAAVAVVADRAPSGAVPAGGANGASSCDAPTVPRRRGATQASTTASSATPLTEHP